MAERKALRRYTHSEDTGSRAKMLARHGVICKARNSQPLLKNQKKKIRLGVGSGRGNREKIIELST